MLYKASLYYNDGSDPSDGETIYPSEEVLIFASGTEEAIEKAERHWKGTMDELITGGNCEPDAPGIGIEQLVVTTILA